MSTHARSHPVPESRGSAKAAEGAERLPEGSHNAAPELLFPRRRPAQKRSQERFDRILIAARAALVELGFESFTFDEVARRAEVPIGTLYQFFANKYALICELDRVDTAEAVAELEKFSAQVPALQWPEILEEFIDHLARLWWEDPSRRAVWHAVQSTPATRATAAATEQEMIEIIAKVVAPLAKHLDAEERRRLAGLLVHTVSSMLNYAVRDPEPEHFHSLVQETKRMLIAYLFAVAS